MSERKENSNFLSLDCRQPFNENGKNCNLSDLNYSTVCRQGCTYVRACHSIIVPN